MNHKLPKLPYDYSALEPYIDKETLRIHHDMHHAAYVKNLNNVLLKHKALQDLGADELLRKNNELPESVRQTVINNAGGHVNHSLYWKIMSPGEKYSNPKGKLDKALKSTFGDLNKFNDQLKEKAMGVFGSGWAFLVLNKKGKLELTRQSFQNSPLMTGNIPLLGVDVWEHAYYLKYQNRRAEYIDAFLKIINWDEVEKRFNEAT